MNIPGYDEWKLRSPYDDMSAADEARAEIEHQDELIRKLAGALGECLDYFEDRQDADCDQDGFIPNEEMKMAQMIGDVLKCL